ncbi:hypothetical protein GCM10009836_24360 [Pseudonocardia ailaonensis]|uniref:Uncharacterized protein n=1 Tax=Pseudonocardia ailaonensis TaxID=367279 RepID=A0ABN2MYA8_9PSEU
MTCWRTGSRRSPRSSTDTIRRGSRTSTTTCPVLYDTDVYKDYDPALVDAGDFPGLARWLDRLTSVDLSEVDMTGCSGLTEWCRRLDDQATCSCAIPRAPPGPCPWSPGSRLHRDTTVDDVVYRNRPLFQRFEADEVTFSR